MFLTAEGTAHHTPLIVQFINHYVGEPVHHFQVNYTKPIWEKFFSYFGTTPEAVFGEYTVDNAIPWYSIMFVIACILSVVLIGILKGKLSEDDPTNTQMTLEATFLYLKNLTASVIGEHGMKYFPIIGTFAVLILVSNLMGLVPLFMAPTGSVNVTFALAITSFVYYNYVGISENGFVNHLAHLTGPRLPLVMAIFLTPLIFSIELISNMIRPFTLGIRLFANNFADEQLYLQISNIYPPYSHFLVQVLLLLPLGLFVALVQTLVFTLLSMIYISEVSHAPHEHIHGGEHSPATGEAVATAHV